MPEPGIEPDVNDELVDSDESTSNKLFELVDLDPSSFDEEGRDENLDITGSNMPPRCCCSLQQTLNAFWFC